MSQKDSTPADAGPQLQVTMSLEYARAASEALDFYNRMCLGQIEELAYLIRTGTIPVSSREEKRKSASMDDCDLIQEKLFEIKALLGYPSNGSMGIGSPHMSKGGLCSYELKKVIDKALAYHHDPKPAFKGVNYDGLTVRYTTLPAPVARIVGADTSPATTGEPKSPAGSGF
jgi:hypothetical protein